MKKVVEIKTVKKKSLLSGIVLALAALNIIALAFTVVKGEIDYLLGSELHYANGFTLAFSGYPVIADGVGVWLRIYCVFHFIAAALLLLSLGAVALRKRALDFGGFGIFSVISSFVLSVLYMVHGIIALSEASDDAGGSEYYHSSTFAFVPFIFSLILAVVYFYARYKAPEEIELW